MTEENEERRNQTFQDDLILFKFEWADKKDKSGSKELSLKIYAGQRRLD